jgi:hypothetical protein
MADHPQRCENCRFFCRELGECRRHGPKHDSYTHEGYTYHTYRYPSVGADGWCGDFEPGKRLDLIALPEMIRPH